MRLLDWLGQLSLARPSRDERYLADAADLADLERRMRVVDRGGSEPVFVTFNH